jgi:polyhydroxyalkanoate synthesis regulator phasin
VGDDLIPILTRFHREVVLPDIQRVVGAAVEGSERRLRDEIHAGFDALARRIDTLETEYHMLVAGLKRVEERLDRVERRLGAVEEKPEKVALRSELLELKARVDGLQEQVRALEERLEA